MVPGFRYSSATFFQSTLDLELLTLIHIDPINSLYSTKWLYWYINLFYLLMATYTVIVDATIYNAVMIILVHVPCVMCRFARS